MAPNSSAIPKDTKAEPTRAQRLIDRHLQDVLGVSLDEFVADHRQRTPRVSWRNIAREIWQATGEDITHQALATWFPEDSDHFEPAAS